jgi:hypothetical protein
MWAGICEELFAMADLIGGGSNGLPTSTCWHDGRGSVSISPSRKRRRPWPPAPCLQTNTALPSLDGALEIGRLGRALANEVQWRFNKADVHDEKFKAQAMAVMQSSSAC